MRLLLCLLIALHITFPAFADSIYVRKNKEQPTAQNQYEAERELDQLLKQEERKQARTPQTMEGYANDYYKNCLAQKHPVLQGDDLKLLCGCTSAKFSENMTLEQVQAMQTDSKEGLYQRNRMMMFVYAPCIEFPTRALVMHQCINDTKVRYTMKNPSKTCVCLADGVAKDMKERAPEVIKNALVLNPKDLDPLALLLNSSAYENRTIYHTKACIQKYEM